MEKNIRKAPTLFSYKKTFRFLWFLGTNSNKSEIYVNFSQFFFGYFLLLFHRLFIISHSYRFLLFLSFPGAVLLSQNERKLDCIVTFQTHSILQRFMLRFDTLSLDCNDHLYIYDGGHANNVPKVSILN